MATRNYVGQRLSFEDNLCTIRYIGEVRGTKGAWLGVEWDEVSRGKHSGMHNGCHYFECISTSPTAASFVRPTRQHDAARSFSEAIAHKYGSENVATATANVQSEKDTIQISGKEIEEVGFDKIRLQLSNFQELRIVLLDGLRLQRSEARFHAVDLDVWYTSTSSNDITSICPKVIEIDLSRNLFEHIAEVIDICRQMPKLRTLHIGGNRFSSITTLPSAIRCHSPFKYLESLTLDDTMLSWSSVENLCANLPSLRTLSAAGNEYQSVPKFESKSFGSLQSLTLDRNSFTSLIDVVELTRLTQLSLLSLKYCNIQEPTSLEAFRSKTFPDTLHTLDLSHNGVASLSLISGLAEYCPGLRSLRVAHNPVLTNQVSHITARLLSSEDVFLLIVARLVTLIELNYSGITDKDRLNAETYYLAQIAAELSTLDQTSRVKLLEQHPRYKHLCEVYGERQPDAAVAKINPNHLAARFMVAHFKLNDDLRAHVVAEANQPQIHAAWSIKIPRTFTIYTTLGLVGKRIGISPLILELVWETGEEDVVQETKDMFFDIESLLDESMPDVLGRTATKLREVTLLPRTRSIGAWSDDPEITLRVQWSPKDRERVEAARRETTLIDNIDSTPEAEKLVQHEQRRQIIDDILKDASEKFKRSLQS